MHRQNLIDMKQLEKFSNNLFGTNLNEKVNDEQTQPEGEFNEPQLREIKNSKSSGEDQEK